MADRHIRAYEALCQLRSEKGSATLDNFLPEICLIESGLFTPSQIKDIITCRCPSCIRHRSLIKEGREVFQYDEIAAYASQNLRCVFALLVFIQKPAFIISLWKEATDDQNVLRSLGDAAGFCARTNVFEHILAEDPEMLRALDQETEQNWTLFLRPKIGDLPYRRFGPRYKLPIENVEKLGEGVSGEVFAIKVCRGYDGIAEIHGDLATKIVGIPDQDERNSFMALNQVNHPNIAKLFAAFQYERRIHMIYPRSTANLRSFLSDPVYGLGQSDFTNLFTAPLWHQAKGIVHALKTMHHLTENKIGIHFDLKPENILVGVGRDTFRFLITDFGLSVFQDPRKFASVRRGGGDEAYAPPEQENLTRKYDIWSMGCILLELLYFTVWEFDGVERLAVARSGRYRPFWKQGVSTEDVQVQPGIQRAIDELGNLTNESLPLRRVVQSLSLRNIRFVRNMASLIHCMLQRQQHDRPTSRQVDRDFTLIIDDQYSEDGMRPISARVETESYSLTDNGDSVTTVTPPLPFRPTSNRRESVIQRPADDEAEYRPEVFSSLFGLVARSNRQPQLEDERLILQVFKNKDVRSPWMRIVMSLQNEDNIVDSRHVKIGDIKVVPAYAFRTGHTYARSLAGIRLILDGHHQSFMSHDLDGDLRDLRKVHGALMGREIKLSQMISKVCISSPEPRRSKLSWKRDTAGPGQQLLRERSITVQLWREVDRSRRDCHIVIYVDKLAVVIAFSDSFTFISESKNKHTEDSGNEAILSSALNTNAQAVFCSYIHGDGNHEPALALEPNQFRSQCQQNQQRFSEIQLTFRNFQDRRLFVEHYKHLKRGWEQERNT